MMVRDLLQIQKSLGSPKGHPWSHDQDSDELPEDEDEQGGKNLLSLPVSYSLYHKGYTTKHWLSVFRAVVPSS